MTSYALTVSDGLVRGMTVQFAEDHWSGEIGTGVAMSDAAFDRIEPFLKEVCADWTSLHRYGVFELSLGDRIALTDLLLNAKGTKAQRKLFQGLGAWLTARCLDDRPVSVFGY